MSSASKRKVCQYLEEFLKFGFIAAVNDERLPFCLIYQQTLSNESMKRGRLEAHFKAKHISHANSDLNYFKSLKDKFKKRSTIKHLLTTQAATASCTLEASYEISRLLAKAGKKSHSGRGLD